MFWISYVGRIHRTGPLHMAEFIFIRHGSTDNLEAAQWQGWSPVPLSVLGRRQAEATAARLAAEPPIERIFASPLARTWETAQIVAAVIGTEVEQCDALKERMTATRLWGVAHAGSLDYITQAQAHSLDPDWSYEDEESWRLVAVRVQAIVALMRARRPGDGRFVFVTHGLTLRMLSAALLAGIERRLEDWLLVYQNLGSPGCCSITRFSGEVVGIPLQSWNDTAHLEFLNRSPGR